MNHNSMDLSEEDMSILLSILVKTEIPHDLVEKMPIPIQIENIETNVSLNKDIFNLRKNEITNDEALALIDKILPGQPFMTSALKDLNRCYLSLADSRKEALMLALDDASKTIIERYKD